MNDAKENITVCCGNCTDYKSYTVEEFIEKAKEEGFMWTCDVCTYPFKVYLVKMLRPELWV